MAIETKIPPVYIMFKVLQRAIYLTEKAAQGYLK